MFVSQSRSVLSGVMKEIILLPKKEVEDLKMADIRVALNWIKHIKDDYLDPFVRAYRVHDAETWKRISVHGQNFPEYRTMMRARKALRKIWYTERPDFWKKGKKNAKHEGKTTGLRKTSGKTGTRNEGASRKSKSSP